MIGQLRGTVVQINAQQILLDVGGVGYEVHCSYACTARLEAGTQATVVVHTDVKEDSIRLYGFDDNLEKQVFLLLTKVTGVGAKSASELVSRLDKLELLRAIGTGDTDRLQKVKGVGKKTAERIVLELRDHAADLVPQRSERSLKVEVAAVEPAADAVAALEALGFSSRDAERAVERAKAGGLPASAGSSEMVKEALKYV